MQTALAVALSFHILAGSFWAGSAFVVARYPEIDAQRLFVAQLLSAMVVIISGIFLIRTLYGAAFAQSKPLLLIGMVCALIAVAVQIVAQLRARKRAPSNSRGLQRLVAVLLAVTVVSMAAARYV